VSFTENWYKLGRRFYHHHTFVKLQHTPSLHKKEFLFYFLSCLVHPKKKEVIMERFEELLSKLVPELSEVEFEYIIAELERLIEELEQAREEEEEWLIEL